MRASAPHPTAPPAHPAAKPSRAVAPKQPSNPPDVAVLAPTGRDGTLAVWVLERWGLKARLCEDIHALCGVVTDGVGVLLIAEEVLSKPVRVQLLATLARQPSWSDIPLILLTAEGELSRTITDGIEEMASHGNVLLLERPVRIATLITTVRSALRARQRQYEIRDFIEERDRLLDAERRARSEAEKANRAKSEFLAVMSHELRTPLNAIGGYAELIDMGVHGTVTTAQREALQRIQKSERHLLGLIEGVLNYARVESGTVHFDITAVHADELISTAEALVAPQVRTRGLQLIIAPHGPTLPMSADRDKTQQILLNLLSNAIKFTPPGGTIAVSCASAPRGVDITVTDSGVGIAPDKLDRIFEPFVQVDTRLTRTQEGVGLGLAISRDLARGMGGDLTVASTPGVGSVFTLHLPSAPAAR